MAARVNAVYVFPSTEHPKKSATRILWFSNKSKTNNKSAKKKNLQSIIVLLVYEHVYHGNFFTFFDTWPNKSLFHISLSVVCFVFVFVFDDNKMRQGNEDGKNNNKQWKRWEIGKFFQEFGIYWLTDR